jgi:hypothetical protein
VRKLIAYGWILAGAALGVLAWSTMNPGGGRASTAPPTVVDGFMSAVQTPKPGEFPDVDSAVKFLVEQVRTQNLAAVTRVLPIAYMFQRATFRTQVGRLQSLDLNGFFPGQPLTKLNSVALGPLWSSYTKFSVELLYPKFFQQGAVAVMDARAAQQLEARLDPKRLSGIVVKSSKVTSQVPAAKLGPLRSLGVSDYVFARVLIGGIGPVRAFEFALERIGSNWLVVGVDPA